MALKFLRTTAVLVVLAGCVGVGAHDGYCRVELVPFPLCVRPDGSMWRSVAFSGLCACDDDPNFDGAEECPESEHLSEDWRHSCAWVFDREVEPIGEPPFYEGDSPGGGVPGRLGD